MPTTARKFGVDCKNPQCGKAIVLGMYTIPLEPGSNLGNFVWTGPWKLICPTCGGTLSYEEGELRECL